MITKNKIQVYIKYDSDIDLWARSTSNRDKVISSEEWYYLDDVVQDFILIKNNLSSSKFKEETKKKMLTRFDGLQSLKLIEEYTYRRKENVFKRFFNWVTGNGSN